MLSGVESEITRVVECVRPAVVRIERAIDPSKARDDPRIVGGSGSGILIDRTGLLLTNDHVVRGAPELTVTLSDGEELLGSVRGEDPMTDLALLALPEGAYASAPLGDSSMLRVGQLALAIGNSLGLPGEATVSLGVVSALGRPLPGSDFVLGGLLQTDAAINPGNSGGPLVNLAGEVIGITTAIVPFAQGVGFAVPSNTARQIVAQLRKDGRVVRPWLGISVAPLTPSWSRRVGAGRTTGLGIADVVPTGPAAAAGLRPGDVLFRVGSTGIRSLRDLVESLAAVAIGGSIDVAFARRAREHRTVVRIAEAPAAASR